MSTLAVNRIWHTPNAADLLVYMARVSSPKNQVEGLNEVQLIKYLLGWRKGQLSFEPPHWSPFEMVHACLEINTTRDIGRQILRHRSFSFQEFSQRYADIEALRGEAIVREARLQDKNNRQNSIKTDDEGLQKWWQAAQHEVVALSNRRYQEALNLGIAKEVARIVLPEGLTPTRMYMCGSFRSWIHYLGVRTGMETQKEHRGIAWQAHKVLHIAEPRIMAAVEETDEQREQLSRA